MSTANLLYQFPKVNSDLILENLLLETGNTTFAKIVGLIDEKRYIKFIREFLSLQLEVNDQKSQPYLFVLQNKI
jgi:hypothetical protein